MTLITPLIETIIKSSIILGLTFFATLAIRRQSAALRHSVWTVGLICSIAVPLFTLVMPAWHVRSAESVHYSVNIVAPKPGATEPEPTGIPTPANVPSTVPWLTAERGLMLACLVWMIGALSVASLLLRETVRLARIAFRACTVEETSWRELVWEVSQALALRRSVRLMRNSNASVLGTWGTLRPRIILPRESEDWSDNRMRVVLGHELAHVKRNDWLIQIVAEAARAIYWFNPLFWVACSHLRRESEHACDDAAMSLGGPFAMDGPTYAGHVLDLARALKHSGQPASVALAMASTSNLERRLIAMLNPSLNRRVTGKASAAIVLLLALALTLPLAALSSQAPIPKVSVIPVVEFAPPKPVEAIASTSVAPQVVQRRIPSPATVVAIASPVAEATPVPTPQSVTGALSGTVSDPTGAVIPGVRINLKANSSGLMKSTITNEAGNFTFTQLSRDNYSGAVELPGFQRTAFSYLVDEPGSARLRITLGIAPYLTNVDISTVAPSGLKCIGALGAYKADGTPFTEADCPGGTVVGGPAPEALVQSAAGPNPSITITKIDTPVEGPSNPADGRRVPIRVGGSIEAGLLMVHPNPAYPAEARSRGVQGAVIISGVVSKDGQLHSLRVISSSNPLLETSVLETLQLWRYKPALLNREPVEMTTVITLNFTLGR